MRNIKTNNTINVGLFGCFSMHITHFTFEFKFNVNVSENENDICHFAELREEENRKKRKKNVQNFHTKMLVHVLLIEKLSTYPPPSLE